MIITGLKELNSEVIRNYIANNYNIGINEIRIDTRDSAIESVWIDKDGNLSALICDWLGKQINSICKKKDKLLSISIDTPFFSEEDTSEIVTRLMYQEYGKLSFLHDMLTRTQSGVTHTFTYALTEARIEEVIANYPSVMV